MQNQPQSTKVDVIQAILRQQQEFQTNLMKQQTELQRNCLSL